MFSGEDGVFGERVSIRWAMFDLVAGVLLPLVCFAIGGSMVAGMLGQSGYKPFVYVGLALQVTAILWDYCAASRFKYLDALLAGVLLAGAGVSLMIGMAILPFSFIGLLSGIGILGFVPFLCAVVYLRHGVHLIRHVGPERPDFVSMILVVAGAILAFVIPHAIHERTTNQVAQLMAVAKNGDAETANNAIARIGAMQWYAEVDASEMLTEYMATTQTDRKAELARRYKELTGLDAEEQAANLRSYKFTD